MLQTAKKNNFNENDAENLAKILASQFSFRNSARVERTYRPRSTYIRPQNEYFQMRAIRESSGATSKAVADLALQMFSRILSRRITQRAIFNNRVSRVDRRGEAKLDNLDNRDLMIRCRRVARRILLRRRAA